MSYRETKRLLTVLGSALLSALAITFFFVWNYGPTGTYQLHDILLNPDVLTSLNYNDYNPKIAHNDRFIFDQIAVETWEPLTQKWERTPMTVTHYATWYAFLSGQKSLSPTPSMEQAFAPHPQAKLLFYVRTESPAVWQTTTKLFQEVQFSPSSGLFRVQLHEQNAGIHWVYFQNNEALQRLMHPPQ